MHTPSPSSEVFEAFGIGDECAMGVEIRGQAFLSPHYVLKPAPDLIEAQWLCDILDTLAPSSEFRVAKPTRAISGEWIAHGFTCQIRVAGEHDMNRWDDVLSAGAALHQSLASISESTWMNTSTAFYQRCDRFAWSDEELSTDPRASETIALLRDFVQPLEAPRQLIHGDLAGNVLFEPNQPPAIIDFTPYWRPALYASGIVIVDAISVRGALPNRLIDDFLEQTDGMQMLVRAALFRAGVYGQQQFYDEYFAGFQKFVGVLADRIAHCRN